MEDQCQSLDLSQERRVGLSMRRPSNQNAPDKSRTGLFVRLGFNSVSPNSIQPRALFWQAAFRRSDVVLARGLGLSEGDGMPKTFAFCKCWQEVSMSPRPRRKQ